MKNIWMIVFMVASTLVFYGCDRHSDTAHEHTTPPTEESSTIAEVKSHTVTDAEVGQTVQCPVMGTKFKVGKNTLSLEYKNKVYYFCCAGCPEDFKAAPEKYTNRGE